MVRGRLEEEEVGSDSSSSFRHRLTRDERLVEQMKIPLTVSDIIQRPMEEFNDLVANQEITEEQINICRDIRRRGKNKVITQKYQADLYILIYHWIQYAPPNQSSAHPFYILFFM